MRPISEAFLGSSFASVASSSSGGLVLGLVAISSRQALEIHWGNYGPLVKDRLCDRKKLPPLVAVLPGQPCRDAAHPSAKLRLIPRICPMAWAVHFERRKHMAPEGGARGKHFSGRPVAADRLASRDGRDRDQSRQPVHSRLQARIGGFRAVPDERSRDRS